MTRGSLPESAVPALDRARRKAYWRLLPLLFICYVIAYVDRANVAIAKLTMTLDLPGFDNAVIGHGAGLFFIGYFLLEISGTLLVEKWSDRKWICRIMITWGIMAALTAFVKTPVQFYAVRFLLGLSEAGFFPGVAFTLTFCVTPAPMVNSGVDDAPKSTLSANFKPRDNGFWRATSKGFSSAFTREPSLKRGGGWVKCCDSNRSSRFSASFSSTFGSSGSSCLPSGGSARRSCAALAKASAGSGPTARCARF